MNFKLCCGHLKLGRRANIVTVFVIAVRLFARVAIEEPSLPFEALVEIERGL